MCFDIPFYFCLITDLILLAIIIGIPIGIVFLIRWQFQSDVEEDMIESAIPGDQVDK